MNDYLTRLASRILKTEPMVEARLPSRFEPVSSHVETDLSFETGDTEIFEDRLPIDDVLASPPLPTFAQTELDVQPAELESDSFPGVSERQPIVKYLHDQIVDSTRDSVELVNSQPSFQEQITPVLPENQPVRPVPTERPMMPRTPRQQTESPLHKPTSEQIIPEAPIQTLPVLSTITPNPIIASKPAATEARSQEPEIKPPEIMSELVVQKSPQDDLPSPSPEPQVTPKRSRQKKINPSNTITIEQPSNDVIFVPLGSIDKPMPPPSHVVETQSESVKQGFPSEQIQVERMEQPVVTPSQVVKSVALAAVPKLPHQTIKPQVSAQSAAIQEAAQLTVVMPTHAATKIRTLVEPQSPVHPERPTEPNDIPDSAPSVQISIGRIEVWTTPEPEKKTARSRKRPPVMELNEHLRRRDGGREK